MAWHGRVSYGNVGTGFVCAALRRSSGARLPVGVIRFERPDGPRAFVQRRQAPIRTSRGPGRTEDDGAKGGIPACRRRGNGNQYRRANHYRA
ncbi:hypothetical protein C6T53_05600 [Burkholderia multivorans]|nr:hypothetical protein C6T53_05600 [Burkholderia multivorans]